MTGMLAPEFREVVLGRVEVRQVFNIPKGVVAGSYVTEGKITSTSQVRLLRNGIVIHEGQMESLRRFKDDVKEVAAGYECGITLEKYRDVKEGDLIEAFMMEQIPR
jgi:translation initiation factor IF-2